MQRWQHWVAQRHCLWKTCAHVEADCRWSRLPRLSYIMANVNRKPDGVSWSIDIDIGNTNPSLAGLGTKKGLSGKVPLGVTYSLFRQIVEFSLTNP